MLRLNGLAAVVIFAALTAVVSLQVANRLVLHLPLIWSEEVARFLFFWVALLGAAISVRKRRHFVLDIMVGRTRPQGRLTRVFFLLVPDLCVLAFAIFLLAVGLGYTGTGRFRTATNSEINMGVVYAAIPVFAGLTIAYSAANLIRDIRALRTATSSSSRGEPARTSGSE